MAEKEEPLTQIKRSRRELLAGAAGALGVLAAEAIGKAAPARAANGDPMILGQDNVASSETGLFGPASIAFFAGSTNASPPATAIWGAAGGGTGDVGILGYNSGPGAQAGVWGSSDHAHGVHGATIDGVAVVGQVTGAGRGGVFHGGAAQLKLSPSSASTHPKRGQKGDLFVDKSGRLWFCKGRYTWVQLA